jgi:hypothetical protein
MSKILFFAAFVQQCYEEAEARQAPITRSVGLGA